MNATRYAAGSASAAVACRLNPHAGAPAASWLAFRLPARVRGALRRLKRDRIPAVWFAPDRPRPSRLVWAAAAAWAGVRIAEHPSDAAASVRRVNFQCRDVSKSRVAAVFEAVFGYPLALDPTTTRGYAVEKSEAGGVNERRVVRCPRQPAPGRIYQRLIDNLEDNEVVDLRTPFVGGKPVVVFVKRRPIHRRFDTYNSQVSLARPEQVFSTAEIERLSAFVRAMKLDWGGLEILRDRASNRIYVVDVNKADMPPLALTWRDKLRAVSRLARAFRQLIEEETNS
ncbi:MAG TPA: hypothetical protein VMT68_12450 [Caulobacteraceae bacterium]|nr:hypothetical protein [Caulobacteraceae bacterium]